ncbi:MAG TPA: hypothetical protein DCM08_10045 [Microscillaceae bacterium]|jgi:hypothetical protein|nr:hypothetical protein [Microscillaceae bacterium]
MRSVLLYNLFPVNHWQEVTQSLLQNHHHDELYIHITLPWWKKWFGNRAEKQIREFLTQYTTQDHIFCSTNQKKLGEVIGFNVFRQQIDFQPFEMATYIHSKGVSRPENKNIADWTAMMGYFVLEKHAWCKEVFEKGKSLYGCNLNVVDNIDAKIPEVFRNTKFWFSGNFVSINLQKLHGAFLQTPCEPNYYGIERFWGRLCEADEAYCPFDSTPLVNHYDEPFPASRYVNAPMPPID